MSKILFILRALLRTALILLASFILLVLFAMLASATGFQKMLFHLVAGFWFFLIEKLPAVSSDAGTWGPGLAAWLVSLAVGHRFLRRWAAGRGLQWRVTTTTCLGLLLPVLFAMSFIVPGILLQVDGLRKVSWFARHSGKPSSMAKMEMRNLAQACAGFANISTDGKFPDSLDVLVKKDFVSRRLLDLSGDKNIPPEHPIYLGTGCTRDTAGDAPLAISPCFQDRGSLQRIVVTVDGTMIVIQDDEVDAWIDRVIPR